MQIKPAYYCGIGMSLRILAGCLSALTAPSLVAEDLWPALRACRNEQDDARRLACYDRQFDARLQPPADAAEVAPSPSDATVAAEDRFGMEGELVRSERERAREEGRELDELRSTVAQFDRRPDGVLIITLANGQVWVPKEFEPYFSLSIGDPVRIRRGALGSYILNGRSNRSTRVKRLQ